MILEGTVQTARHGQGTERMQPKHARAGAQIRTDVGAGILGRGPDECDASRFQFQQQRILLGTVETVPLVEKQQRARPAGAVSRRRAF